MAFFEVTQLSKSYKNVNALKGVSFQVNQGEIVALIGQNGAGKTTLLNCIAGNITPNGGSVTYKDSNILENNSLLNEFGILIQASFFDYMDAYDNLVLLMEASSILDKVKIRKKVDEILTLVGLAEKKHAYVKSYSFGMKQRLGLAQTLLHDPQFLMLDEPFVGLDPIGKEMLKKTIIKKAREENAGVLFSSHDLFDVSEICDRIVMFDHGEKIYDDVFKYMRTYHVTTTSPVEDETKKILLRQFSEKICFKQNTVEFADAGLLHGVVQALVSSKLVIADIRTTENSLYDYFKQEVTS